MPFAGNFHPEWGYLAPAPSFMRSVRMVLVATAVGATAGAATVFALMDHTPTEQNQPVMPARTAAAKALDLVPHEIATPVNATTNVPASPPSVPEAPAAAAWAELNAAPAAPVAKPAPGAKAAPMAKAEVVDKAKTPEAAAPTLAAAEEPSVELSSARAAPPAPAVAEAAAEKKKPAKKKVKVVRRKPQPDEPYGRDGYSDWRTQRHAGDYYGSDRYYGYR